MDRGLRYNEHAGPSRRSRRDPQGRPDSGRRPGLRGTSPKPDHPGGLVLITLLIVGDHSDRGPSRRSRRDPQGRPDSGRRPGLRGTSPKPDHPGELVLITLLIVDDHPVVRDGLAALIDTVDNVVVVAQADTAEGAIGA